MSCRKKNLDKMYYLKKNNFTAYANQKKKRPEVNGVAL